MFSLGLHYLQSFAIFLGLSCAVAWAANHDPVSVFGVVGTIGDQMTWACNFGWVAEMIGLSMLTFAMFGEPPNGLNQSDIFFIVYGGDFIERNVLFLIFSL